MNAPRAHHFREGTAPATLQGVLRSSSLLALPVLSLLGALALGCGGPDPKMVAAKNDGVPANSASEERLASGEPKKKEDPKTANDPSQPYTQPVGGSGDSATPTATGPATKGGPKEVGGGKAGGKSGDGTTGKAGAAETKGGKDKVSQTQCKATLDRYLDLMMASDSRFAGIPPEMLAQIKQQGFSQVGGPNPCDTQGINKTQYDCAMAATTTKAWEHCMPK